MSRRSTGRPLLCRSAGLIARPHSPFDQEEPGSTTLGEELSPRLQTGGQVRSLRGVEPNEHVVTAPALAVLRSCTRRRVGGGLCVLARYRPGQPHVRTPAVPRRDG